LAALCNFHPFVLTAWGTDILNLPHASRFKIGKLLTQYTLKKADLLTATSEYLKYEMIKLGADREKIHVIFWGVNTQKFRPDVDTTQIRNKLGIEDNRPVVLSNRNHIALYNNDIVIEAMYHVLKKFPKAVLILQNAGGGLEEDLKSLARKKGIEKSVIFLPQFKHDDMPPLYAMSDVYVSVPSWDAGPVSLKEAMASHSVPIISAVPGPMEWVEDESNGRVVSIRDKDKLSDAICDLLQHKDKREKFNKINRKMIEDKADQNNYMKMAEEIYKRLIVKPI
jgi:glycosyltransferase involved in cell wall biosynthesis